MRVISIVIGIINQQTSLGGHHLAGARVGRDHGDDLLNVCSQTLWGSRLTVPAVDLAEPFLEIRASSRQIWSVPQGCGMLRLYPWGVSPKLFMTMMWNVDLIWAVTTWALLSNLTIHHQVRELKIGYVESVECEQFWDSCRWNDMMLFLNNTVQQDSHRFS